MSNPSTLNRRWYDGRPDISGLIEFLIHAPFDMQEVLAAGLVIIAERQHRAFEIIQAYRSLGPEKVLALYRSKNKRREYDRSQLMHKLFNYLTILPESDRNFVREQMELLLTLVFDYLTLCRKEKSLPSIDELGRLTTMFVNEGEERAREYLGAVHRTLRLQRQPEIIQTDRTGVKSFANTQETQDLRLRREQGTDQPRQGKAQQ